MLDYLGIFKRFNEEGVRYLVVGGLAMNLLGVPRVTYDIDILIDMTDENIEVLMRLMKEWGFKPKLPVKVMDFADREKRKDWIETKHMKAFNLVNAKWALSEIDIIIDAPVAYPEARKHAKKISVQGISIPVISIDDLIKMKTTAGREMDKADIQYLRRVKNGKK
ncbi:MAG: nucleotidyltransferase [Nitrospirota bacterium]|nr:nucleotidyltransferase [Nitrospirota bacterium]